MKTVYALLLLCLVSTQTFSKMPNLNSPFLLFWGPKGPSVCIPERKECVEGAFVKTDFATVLNRPHFQSGDYLFSKDGYYSDFPIPHSDIYPDLKNGMSISINPDKTLFVYNRWIADTKGLCIQSLNTPTPNPRCIVESGSHYPLWLDNNTIAYRDGDQLSGSSILSVDPNGKQRAQTLFKTDSYIYKMDLSPSRQKIVLAVGGFVLGTLDWRTGEQVKWGEHTPAGVLRFELSPDEKHLAYIGDIEPYDQKTGWNKMYPKNIWVIDSPGSPPRALLKIENKAKPGFIFGKGYKGASNLTWSPDGKQIAFTASLDGDCAMANEGGEIRCKQGLYVVNVDGTGFRQLSQIKSEKLGSPSWIDPSR